MDTSDITYRQIGRDDKYRIWHSIPDHIRFIYVHRGDGSVVFKDDIFPLHAGGLYLIGDGALHYTLPEHPEGYERSKLLMKSSRLYALPEIRRLLSGCKGKYAALSDGARKQCEEIFGELADIDPLNPMRETLMAAAAFRLSALLCSHHSTNFDVPVDHVTKVVDYINRNVSEPITLDMICADVGISKCYLCHHFKAQMKMTVMEYIHQTRIEFAKELLLSASRLTVSEISEACGFTNLSFFGKTFKRLTGLSPKAFRAAHPSSVPALPKSSTAL